MCIVGTGHMSTHVHHHHQRPTDRQWGHRRTGGHAQADGQHKKERSDKLSQQLRHSKTSKEVFDIHGEWARQCYGRARRHASVTPLRSRPRIEQRPSSAYRSSSRHTQSRDRRNSRRGDGPHDRARVDAGQVDRNVRGVHHNTGRATPTHHADGRFTRLCDALGRCAHT